MNNNNSVKLSPIKRLIPILFPEDEEDDETDTNSVPSSPDDDEDDYQNMLGIG